VTTAPGAPTVDAIEQSVLAFAEQVGRIAGTLQAKAEGWMERKTLNTQIARVRDGAADLLQQLAGGATRTKPAGTGVRGGTKGRSGGVVDAPGKKHRKPMPADPGATLADSQAAKMRTAKTMVKTNRRRGRAAVNVQDGWRSNRYGRRASGRKNQRLVAWSQVGEARPHAPSVRCPTVESGTRPNRIALFHFVGCVDVLGGLVDCEAKGHGPTERRWSVDRDATARSQKWPCELFDSEQPCLSDESIVSARFAVHDCE
jgi:hypothetical protein